MTLTYDVYVTPSIPTTIADLPPDLDHRSWSPTSSTLIHGERDAVLVDAFLTIDQASALTEWVSAFKKNLTTIYITHAHGDHWFGVSTLLARFPEAKVVAVPAVVDQMKKQMSSEFLDSFWNSRFPGQIPSNLTAAEELTGGCLELEGEELRVVELGHTDTDDTTALHVPSLDLVVSGDAAYNDVHLYLAESPAEGRQAWLAALDKIEDLAPRFVVAGHKRADRPDDPGIIDETRRYILDFEAAAARTSSTLELYRTMVDLHPTRINKGAVWGSARSVKG